jgi:hypothetical protein
MWCRVATWNITAIVFKIELSAKLAVSNKQTQFNYLWCRGENSSCYWTLSSECYLVEICRRFGRFSVPRTNKKESGRSRRQEDRICHLPQLVSCSAFYSIIQTEAVCYSEISDCAPTTHHFKLENPSLQGNACSSTDLITEKICIQMIRKKWCVEVNKANLVDYILRGCDRLLFPPTSCCFFLWGGTYASVRSLLQVP